MKTITGTNKKKRKTCTKGEKAIFGQINSKSFLKANLCHFVNNLLETSDSCSFKNFMNSLGSSFNRTSHTENTFSRI